MKLDASQPLISNFSPASLAAIVILTALFLVVIPLSNNPQGFILRLPQQSQTRSSGEINLMLTAKGDLLLNNKRVTLQSLGKQLSDRLARTGDSTVVIRSDRDVRFHQTMRVFEIARHAGASRVILAN